MYFWHTSPNIPVNSELEWGVGWYKKSIYTQGELKRHFSTSNSSRY
jgi:hypothetical protein